MANVSYNFGSPKFTPIIKEATNKQILLLDGVNDYLEIPDANAIDFGTNQNFTVESWFKVDPSQNTEGDIIEKWKDPTGYPYVIRYDGGSGKVVAARYDRSNNPSIVSTRTFNDGQSHHVAFVKDGNQLKLYVDGQLDGTTTDTTTGNTQNNSPLFIGNRGGIANHFKGEIEELRIWNVARTPAEIQSNLNTTFQGTEAGLAGYWNFDQDNIDGTIAQDATANGNDGTLKNGAKLEIDDSFIGYVEIVLDQAVTVAPGAIIEYRIEGPLLLPNRQIFIMLN
ncbi:LamG domain-containing protein [Okeania sp.]|uniref:LamG domain-containing protein n=1 Tax=Okeania sp. TaxID=3100323 RepID=UPI002B4B0ED1|nr:LamG domain-containing protein [Okeania sp.]MEB3340847.1 LamG domain-containing protein [Okeania sp.]